MSKVQLPDGSILEAAERATVRDIAEQIGPGLAKAAIAGRINGESVDLSTPITDGANLEIITSRDDEGLDILRHSCAHIMAEAICSLWPEAKLVYGPAVRDGFYYDLDLDEPIRPEDFQRIEQKMSEIIAADTPFERVEMSRTEALEKMAGFVVERHM